MNPIEGTLNKICVACGKHSAPQTVAVTGYKLPKEGQRGGIRITFTCPKGHHMNTFIGKDDARKLGIKGIKDSVKGACGCPYAGKGEEMDGEKLEEPTTSNHKLGSRKSRSRKGGKSRSHSRKGGKSRSHSRKSGKPRSRKSRSRGHK